MDKHSPAATNGHKTENTGGDEEIINKAKATAAENLKSKYDLDVEITETKLLPEYIAHEVRLQGHVIGANDQHFNITVNYKTDTTSNFAMSPELVNAIKAKGIDPFQDSK